MNDPAWVQYDKRALLITRKTKPPFEQWAELMQTMNQINQSHNFWVGDLYLAGERFYGEAQATSIMDATDWNLKTLQNAAWVCGKIEPARRREELSFSHHAEISALDPDEQDHYLTLAIENGLSVRRLRELIKSDRGDDVGLEIDSLNGRCDALAKKIGGLIADIEMDLPGIGSDAVEYLLNAHDALDAAGNELAKILKKQEKAAA